jgi:hypothetical protein
MKYTAGLVASIMLTGIMEMASAAVISPDIIINFEDMTATGYGHEMLTPQGFTFTSAATIAVRNDVYMKNGTNMYAQQTSNLSTPHTLTLTAGGSFDIISLDIGGITSGPITTTYNFTGYYASGGSVQSSVDSSGGIIKTVNFDNTWTNLSAFEFLYTSSATNNGLEADNFIVRNSSIVPIPAAIWLFCSGLAGLIGLGRWKVS